MEYNSTYYNSSIPEYEIPIEIGKQKENEDIFDEEEPRIDDEIKHHL